MRCLVTGATGFIGSRLAKKLLREGHAVAALVRPTSDLWRLRGIAPDVTMIHGDIAGIGGCRREVMTFSPDVVYHLAWAGANSQRYVNDPSQVFDNLPGGIDLVRISAEAGASTFITSGSVVEYGPVRVPVREDDPLCPTNLYGKSKHAFSQLSKALCEIYAIRFCELRVFWTYGPYDDALRMIPYLIRRLLAGEKPALTAGEQFWDYLYIEDAVAAFYEVAMNPTACGHYNLGSGVAYRLRDVIEKIRDFIDPTLQLGFGEVPYGPNQVMHLQADITCLQKATGWSPKMSLDDGLRLTTKWCASQI